MAYGTLAVDTLNSSSGVLATQNGMTGIAKAWVSFNGANGSIYGSFNVSSVTYVGTGVYIVNMATAMSSSSYTATASCSAGSTGQITTNVFVNNSSNVAPTTSAFYISCGVYGVALYNPAYVNAIAIGN